jgi:hypothetical protein
VRRPPSWVARPALAAAHGSLNAYLRTKQIGEVVSPAADWLYGYAPATGKELWKMGYGVLGFSIVPRPWASAIVALPAFCRLTKKVSFGLPAVSTGISTARGMFWHCDGAARFT